VAEGVSDVPRQILGMRDDFHIADPASEDQRAVERRACPDELSLRVPQYRCSSERSRLGCRRKVRLVQNLFVPLETFGGVSSYEPEILEAPRDVGRFRRPTALEEPRQRGAGALAILACA